MAEEATMTAPTGAPASTPAETSASTATGEPTSSGSEVRPQEQPQAPSEKPAESAKPDFSRQYEADPEFRAYVKREADRLAQQRIARDRRNRERDELARAKDDPVRALEYVQSRHHQVEQETVTEDPHEQARSMLADLAKNATWAEIYNELRATEGAKFHTEYAKDPVGFMERVDDRITEILIDRRATEKAKVMAEALATEKTNKALEGLAVPPTGNGASGDNLLLERFAKMGPSERRVYYREHEKEINEAEQRRINGALGR